MKRSLLFMVVLLAFPAAPQQAKKLSAREEIARLEKELADQRALLVRILELQVERDQQMLRLAQGLPVQAAAAPSPVAARTPDPPRPVEAADPPSQPAVSAPAASRREPKTADVTGRVHVSTGGAAWVFVEDVRGTGSGVVEIRQQDKQFSPRLAAIPRGGKVTFPNYDVLYHNVFSVTPGSAFDLGMLRAGDTVKSQTFDKPGVVEIFCNLHSKMSAAVLVTPGPLMAKVAADGTFRIPNVPLGTHKLSAWAGGQEIVTQSIDVGASGATAEFKLKAGELGAHKNKLGQPYGSYDD